MSQPSPSPPAGAQHTVYTVSQLNRETKGWLEQGFPRVWVEGEISNLARPGSGHLYFSLKDAQAQVRCAMFRGKNRQLRFAPEDGMQVLVRARVSLYEPRGDYQLLVEHLEEAGHGALQRAYEALKARLAEEGLFDQALKRPLPALPQRIGVITSPSGAAIRDILSVLKRRFPAIPVLIYPVQVQGTEAAPRIVKALELASRRAECDVLILARGGGSLEDLWPFNEEAVARALRATTIPVVSGVGHEVDFTIADLAADLRAPTPSAAAEAVTPDGTESLQTVARLAERGRLAMTRRLGEQDRQVGWLAKRLKQQHPGQRLTQGMQRLDELTLRLDHAWRARINDRRSRAQALELRLAHQDPRPAIARYGERTGELRRRLGHAVEQLLERRRSAMRAAARALESVSPLATLGRGYAIVQHEDGTVVRAADGVTVGGRVQARLARGRLHCRVEDRDDDTARPAPPDLAAGNEN